MAMANQCNMLDNDIEILLSRKPIYTRLKAFPKEISAVHLATTARTCLTKFRNDFKIGGFHNLLEWRCSIDAQEDTQTYKPDPQDYRLLISDDNAFRPSLLESMQTNSERLSAHLKAILSLSNADAGVAEGGTCSNPPRPILNSEVIEHATQHDLPIFVSIDGGLKHGIATVCVTILAPDIKDNDTDAEWKDRPAKALLIRSWQLPKQWGTSLTCINMAESLGFIIGEYTIPSDLPVIYITDSNNARTLQRNVKNSKDFTHRKYIRKVKQGIDHSIANHLEYLTSKWPKPEQMSAQTRATYLRGEAMCKKWTKLNSPPATSARIS